MLLSPGPVPVPDFIMQAICAPVIHHRGPVFETLMEGLRRDLQYLFQGESAATCLMMGSGTVGVEAAMYSLFQPADRVLIVNYGKFSERWVDFGKLMGLDVIPIQTAWGQSPSAASVLETAARYPDLSGVILTHCETSTGAMIDVEEIAFALKQTRPELLLLVDGVSSIGALPFYFDEWNIDCAVVASQKALMNPAGTVAFALSAYAQSRLRPTHPSDARNLHNYLRLAQQNSFPYTPPVQLFYGWQAALAHFRRRSLPEIWNQCHQSARAFRTRLEGLGGALLAPVPADSLSAFSFPQQDHEAIRKNLHEQHGIFLAGAQGALKGKILRISHMGAANAAVMEQVGDLLHEMMERQKR